MTINADAIQVPYKSLRDDTLRAPTFGSGWAGRLIAAALVISMFWFSHSVLAQDDPPICGNGIIGFSEDCDDGGTCLGGSNAGTHCTAESDCQGNGMCVGGTKQWAACADDVACPGGRCQHCVPQGGDGCAANCTFETDVPFPFVPGQYGICAGGPSIGRACSSDGDCNSLPCNYGLTILPGGSGVTVDSDFISVPLPFGGACSGGDNVTRSCNADPDCPGGTCLRPQETLTIGKAKAGKIPVVVKANSVNIPGIKAPIGCWCIRGVAAKTCGGTIYELDGVTPATDCSPGFTPGDSVCSATGKLPCTSLYGAGNTASGEIGCDSLEHINVVFSQDSGGVSGVAGPPMLMFTGSGGPGSALVLSTFGVSGVLGGCGGSDPTSYGPDGVFCTADDPAGGIISVAGPLPVTTGAVTAVVLNANGADGMNLGPVTTTGAPFSCTALAQGSAAGAGLVLPFAAVHLDTVGDVVFTGQFFAGPPLPVPSTPTPTPVTISSCVGACANTSVVQITDLLLMVNIALGNAPFSACPGVEQWCNQGDLGVVINCIIVAVNNALEGCPGPTPTFIPTPTPNG